MPLSILSHAPSRWLAALDRATARALAPPPALASASRAAHAVRVELAPRAGGLALDADPGRAERLRVPSPPVHTGAPLDAAAVADARRELERLHAAAVDDATRAPLAALLSALTRLAPLASVPEASLRVR